jgi:transcription termination/antitermination protein NusG
MATDRRSVEGSKVSDESKSVDNEPQVVADPAAQESNDSAAEQVVEPTEAVESAGTAEAVADDGASSESDEASADSAEVEEFDDDDEEQVDEGPVEPLELIEDEPADDVEKHWYILKVQVNREDSIREALVRRVKMHGLDDFFEDVVVPTEDVVEFTKTGRKRTVKRKLYPGYIMVHMAITDESWFLVRETSGIGDFTGSAGKPTPMDANEVERIIAKPQEEDEEDEVGPRIDIPFNPEDRVRVKDGNFLNFEGGVESIDATHGRVTVIISIFGRPTPVELEHWQIEAM